jgi:hypothetical protein
MKKLGTIIVAFFTVYSAVAQPDVTIEGTGSREVEKAYRIAGVPQIIDTTIPMATVDYPLLQLQFETSTDVNRINPVSIRTQDKLVKLYNTYVKLGIGTELMPLGEIYFDATRSRKFLYGAHLKHLSSFGNIPDRAPAQFDRTRFGLYGAINERKYTARGDVHYNNEGLHYYGISDTVGLSKDSIAQRYSDLGFAFSYGSHKKDSANLNYTVGMVYNNYKSKKPLDELLPEWRARENYFAIETKAEYLLGKEVYAGEFNIRYNGYKYGIVGVTGADSLDSSIVRNNTVVNLKPTITTTLQDNRFKAKVGIDLTIDGATDKVRAHIYPIAELKYSMFNDIFIPYVGLRGGLTQGTFKGLTTENEFLLPNVHMENEHKAIDFYGGFKGTMSKRVSFNIGANFANVKNMGMFVTDTTFSLGNKFDVIYDTANVATIEGSISYQLREKLKIDAIGKFHSYTLLNNSYAWNKPALEVMLRGSYNLFDKFLFNLDFKLEQGRRALVDGPGENITLENGQYAKKLDIITDANISVEYRYNNRISAFVQFNNIASQRYQRWYETPVQSFQVLGGVTFRL